MTAQQWRERNRPARLEKRYEFEGYDALREFLERAADLSEEKGLYPDIGFGRSYANFTIHAEEDSEVLSETQREFARLLDSLNVHSKA